MSVKPLASVVATPVVESTFKMEHVLSLVTFVTYKEVSSLAMTPRYGYEIVIVF
jgi:hypothetical protein